MFRREVIDHALPFPAGPGWDFHDHWLALVAMALGDVAYVDRPLYDYVQHPGAVLGRAASKPRRRSRGADSPGLRARLERRRGFFDRWRSAYFSLYLQREFHARVLLARCGGRAHRAQAPGAAAASSAAARSPLGLRLARRPTGARAVRTQRDAAASRRSWSGGSSGDT